MQKIISEVALTCVTMGCRQLPKKIWNAYDMISRLRKITETVYKLIDLLYI